MTTTPPAPPQRDQRPKRVGETIVAIVLWVGLTAVAVVVGFMSLLLVMASDSCGTSDDDPLLCQDAGGALFFVGIGVEWLLLAVAVLGSLVLIVKGAAQCKHVWHWPFVGLVLAAVAVVGMFGWTVFLTR